MMKKVMRYGTLIPIVLAFLSLGFIFSCALSPVQQEVGLVTLNFGPANSAQSSSGTSRDLVALPAFSSISVKVLGTGIPEKEYSPAQFSAPLVITVPAGINRSIMIKAIPAPSGTAPSLAKSYSGLAVFDLAIGETKNIPIKLAVSETKIILPDQRNGNLLIANSIDSGAPEISFEMPSINNQSDFEFDSRGRLFISDGSEINRYTAFSGSVTPDLTLSASNVALAYDAPRNRLYASHKSTGNLTYFDLNQDTPGQVYVNDPVGYTFTEGGVAVDSSGNVFIVADNGSGTKGILKISIGTAPGEPLEAPGTFLAFTPESAIGIDTDINAEKPWQINDMTVKDGVLYISASQIYASSGHSDPRTSQSGGKVIALSTANLSKLGSDIGWHGDGVSFPTDPNKNTQFYGPGRFIGIAPRKLYLIDEGFYIDPFPVDSEHPYIDVDRVAEVDLDTRKITKISFANEDKNGEFDVDLDFFQEYSTAYYSFC